MIRCLIIDDEPLAVELLEDFVSKVPFLNLVKSCSSAFEAISVIQDGTIDLIFSDIEMPDFTGIEFIKSIKNKPLFIFTTAYSHYAVEGFNLNAVDYLVKPIPFHRFLTAVNRAQELFELKAEPETAVQTLTAQSSDFIFVKSEYENLKVNLNTIRYIEGLKDYIKIYTDDPKPILTLNSLKAFEEKLPPNFIRVHRSFIVSLNHINSVQRNRIIIDKVYIPIGQNYKDDFIKRIEN
ncbi:LytR/AlgR family response regulator transcription factor [Lutibacter holmesii]|uniref:LytR/AlgR family response regulator transcription factor n=1 Tax=Lutibacter holmesii TaxID=1137985 RepID=A0ABW3WKX8_9FLAO